MSIVPTPISLETLPLEVLLLIFDVGQLSTGEATALRSTCSQLLAAIDTRPLWFLIASHGQPLQFPAFRPISSLLTDELRRACTRTFHCKMNLESPNPAVRSHRKLVVKGDQAITHFAFLPGGYYVLIVFDNGVTQLWGLSYLPTSTEQGAPTNLLLAQHDSKAEEPISGFSFRTYGEDEKLVVITTISARRLDVPNHLEIFSFRLDLGDSVHVVEYVSMTMDMGDPVPALGPFGLVAVLDGSLMAGPASLLLLDYTEQMMLSIDTGCSNHEGDSQYDVILTDEKDLIFLRGSETGMEFHVYFDVAEVLHTRGYDVKSTSGNHPLFLHPNTSKSFTFAEEGRFEHHHPWYTIHPWNTPGIRTHQRLQIVSVSPFNDNEDGPADDHHLRSITSQWVDIDQIARSLKTGPTSSLPGGRNFCHLLQEVATGFDFTWLWVLGTAGTHMAWISTWMQDDDGGRRWNRAMQILTLPSGNDLPAPEDGKNLQEGLRQLQLPDEIDLNQALVMDFCDEAGVLALGVKMTDTGEQCLHFFQY